MLNRSKAEAIAKENSLNANLQLYKDLKVSLDSCMQTFGSAPAVFNDILNSANQLAEGASSISSGAGSLSSGISKLSTSSTQLVAGAKTLSDGSQALSNGVKTLNLGSSQMKSGLSTLNTGMEKLFAANAQLTDGAKTLSSGATTLSDGMTKFNQEGIGAICDYLGGDFKDVSLRLEKLQDLANEYQSFSSLHEGASGNVKFMMIVDGIKASGEKKEEVIFDKKEEN